MLRYIRIIFSAIVAAIAVNVAIAGTVTHKVKKGETVYGISNTYGVTMDEFYKYNPSARDGIKVGQTLILPDKNVATKPQEKPKAKEPAPKTPAIDKTYHTIQKGETLYGIARQYGISVEDLLALNPHIDAAGYQVGSVLRLTDRTAPVAKSSAQSAPPEVETVGIEVEPTVKPAAKPAAETKPAATTEAKPAPQVTEHAKPQTSATVAPQSPAVAASESKPVALNEAKPLSIALLLPLMLNDENGKKSTSHIEFYRGFMLAADSLSHSGKPVKIYVYDTANSLDTVNEILRRPELKTATAIIAPENEAQLAAIARHSVANGNWVVNVFAVKDTTFVTNPMMIQANIPHDEMYGKAIDKFISSFRDFTPVFLNNTGYNHDKSEFTDMLQKQLKAEGIDFTTISYTGTLQNDQLSELNRDGKYVFIPLGSSRKEFGCFTPALKEFKEEFVDPYNIRIFGYPEWTTFRDDNLTNLGKLNATIYSRFYDDRQDTRTTAVVRGYERWFNQHMAIAYPTQGLLGFDTGYYLIDALRATDGDLRKARRHEGVQTAFELDGDSDQGLVNMGLFFITFRPSGFIDKVALW